MPKHFIKVREDFFCAHCRQPVFGDGYTNHCPNCLYSQHIDDTLPGDRALTCLGLMKPISLQIKHAKYVLFHQCQKCHKITRNRTSKNDNHEKLIKLSTKPIKLLVATDGIEPSA